MSRFLSRKTPVKLSREQTAELIYLLFETGLKRAYLDIETDAEFVPTVVGIFIPEKGFYQLTRPNIKADHLHRIVEDVDLMVTYNGERFDLEVLRRKNGFSLPRNVRSLDLMYLCWDNELFGGLKKVEKALGIKRDSIIDGFNGLDAIRLWEQYEYGDRTALSLLLLYNRYDVLNLCELERRLRQLYEEKLRRNHPTLDLYIGP